MGGSPLSLAQALELTTECRIVTTATRPYTIVHTNRAWSELTQYKFTEAVGQTCSFLQGPATQTAALQLLEAAIEAKQKVNTTLINYTRYGDPIECTIECGPCVGGTHFYATVAGTPITDGSVAPLATPAAPVEEEREPLEPISFAEKHRNKRVKRTVDKMRLEEVIANTEDPIVLCSKDYPHVITHPNQAWLEMCGYALEEVEGLTNSILTGPLTDRAALERITACAKAGEPAIETLINYKKGGIPFVNQVHVQPVFDENDELAAFMSMLTEVDECALPRDVAPVR